jgi:hypothetical protein
MSAYWSTPEQEMIAVSFSGPDPMRDGPLSNGSEGTVLRCDPGDLAASMLQTQRSEYLSFRRTFEPASVKLAIVAESPPASGKYFYNPAGAVTEPLFSALMLQLGFAPTSKESGLRKFQQRGWVLVDATTYEPVNALDNQDRDLMITRDYHLLRDDLASMLPNRSTPVILVKSNICRLLGHKLTEDGFNVLNNGSVVYFPSTGRQKDFQRQFSAILKSTR